VVELALSVASITYGPLLGTYLLAGGWPRARGRDIVFATITTVAVMLAVVLAGRMAKAGIFPILAPLGTLAWPWYVPLGTLLTMLAGMISSYLPRRSTS
jgi:hypothetical protein